MALVATNGPRTVGGLPAYLRRLGEELRREGRVDDVVRFPEVARPVAGDTTWAPAAQVARAPEAVLLPRRGAGPALRLAAQGMHRAASRPAARQAFAWAFAPALRRAIAADVTHVHYIGTGWELTGFAAVREARRRGAGFSVCPAVHPGTWGDSPFDIELYAQADAVVALSAHERSALLAPGTLDPARVHVIGLAPVVEPGGDGAGFRASHGLGRAPLVLFVGRNDVYKGYAALRQAMEEVWRRRPDARLVRCGPSGSAADQAAGDPRVLGLGLVDEATKAAALAAADVFCLPSTQESFGLAHVEAWSYAVPVVAGRAPAVTELVTDGHDGLLVDQQPEAIAAALVRLLDDPGLRARVAANGQERQRRDFTWPLVAARHRALFAEARGQGKSATQ